MDENTRNPFSFEDSQKTQAPPSLMPAVLARLGLSEPRPALAPSPDMLKAALTDQDWTVRASAVQELANLRDQASFVLLLTALRDEDSAVRASAVRVLGQRGDPDDAVTRQHLEAAVRDPDWHVRETAIYALDRLGARASISALREAVRDNDDEVRRAAMQAIQHLQAEASEAEELEMLLGPEVALSGSQNQVGTWGQRIRQSALRLIAKTGKEESMLEEIQDETVKTVPIEGGSEPMVERLVSARSVRPRRRLVRVLEQVMAAVLVLAIVLGWFAISHLPRPSGVASPGFNASSARPLSPTFSIRGDVLNYSHFNNWSSDGRFFWYMQTDTRTHQLQMRELDGITGHTAIYPVHIALGSSVFDPNSTIEYSLFHEGHYLIASWSLNPNSAALVIWDITGEQTVSSHVIPANTSGWVPSIIPSHNGQNFALYTPAGTVEIWDVASGQRLVTCKGKVQVSPNAQLYFAWYPDDQGFYAASEAGKLQACDTNTGASLFNLNKSGKVYSLSSNTSSGGTAVSPDGKYLALVAGPRPATSGSTPIFNEMEILNAHTGQVLHTYAENPSWGNAPRFDWLDGQRLLVTYAQQKSTGLMVHALIWNAFTGQFALNTISFGPWNVELSPDKKYLFLGDPDGLSLDVRQTSSGDRVATMAAPASLRADPYMGFSVSNKYLTLLTPNDLYIWSISAGKLLFKYHAVQSFFANGQGAILSWSPNGRYLTLQDGPATGSPSGTIQIWRLS